MTLQTIQDQIAPDFELSTSTPDSDSSEWATRTRLINRYEREWYQTKSGFWPELYTTATLATVAGTSTVSLPADCDINALILRDDGYLLIGSTHYKMISVSEASSKASSSQYVYITGNPAVGYTLNINPTPDSVTSFEIGYYSKYLATDSVGVSKAVLENATDKTKIPVYEYLVYKVLAQLYLNEDNDKDKHITCLTDAERCMMQMLQVADRGSRNEDRRMKFWADSIGYLSAGE